MTYSSFWFGKESDTPLPPAPLDIGNSLRFRVGPDPQVSYLQNEDITIQPNSTFSGWIKIGGEPRATKGPIFGASKDTTGADNATALGWSWAPQYSWYSRNTAGDQWFDPATYQDYAAWYNLVLQFDASLNMTLFVNGVRQTNQLSPINVGSEIVIGRNRVNATDEGFQGYMADLYYIDGQVLPPTAFGKYDDNNKWIPIEYEGNYGNNGFHLTFQPDSITKNSDDTITVADMSGLGNNFTGTGFNVDGAKVPQWQTYAESWSVPYIGEPASVFNGTASTSFEPWEWYAWQTPQGNLEVGGVFIEAGVQPGDVLTFDTYPRGGTVTATLNGTVNSNTGSGNGQKVTLTVTVPPEGLTTCTIVGTDPDYAMVGAFYVNGTMLVNGGSPDYDVMVDSPTQNFATLNPLQSESGTLTGGNLEVNNANSSTSGMSTIGMPIGSGKYYCEVTITNTSGNTSFGLASVDGTFFQVGNCYYSPDINEVVAADGSNDSNYVSSPTPLTTTGTVFGIAYDATTGELWMSQNGTYFTVSGAAGAGDPATGANAFMTVASGQIADATNYFTAYGSSTGVCEYAFNF